jgi:hypothetical protein
MQEAQSGRYGIGVLMVCVVGCRVDESRYFTVKASLPVITAILSPWYHSIFWLDGERLYSPPSYVL